MIQIKRTDSENKDFIELVQHLDGELAERDGEDHSFYAQFNKIDKIKHALVAYQNGKPIACGAIKEYTSDSMEVKRMYTAPENRGKGMATQILSELENWAAELSYKKCILETGKRQGEAIELYKKSGYHLIPNYGQYAEVENSLCFEKTMKQKEVNKMKTTNYFDAFIEVAEDCPANTGEVPPVKGNKKSVAYLQYEMLVNKPYKFTSDDVLFTVFAKRKEIPEDQLEKQRQLFFSKGQPCFRASPLTKRYGWGIHSNEEGKVAMYGVDSEDYQKFAMDESVLKKKAMRSKKIKNQGS